MALGAFAGLTASLLTDVICETNDVDTQTKELLQATACLAVGGTVSALTGDGASLGIVVAQTGFHLYCAATDKDSKSILSDGLITKTP